MTSYDDYWPHLLARYRRPKGMRGRATGKDVLVRGAPCPHPRCSPFPTSVRPRKMRTVGHLSSNDLRVCVVVANVCSSSFSSSAGTSAGITADERVIHVLDYSCSVRSLSP